MKTLDVNVNTGDAVERDMTPGEEAAQQAYWDAVANAPAPPPPLDQQVADLQARVTTAEAANADLQATISNLQSNVTDLQAQTATLQEQTAQLSLNATPPIQEPPA